MAPTDIAGWGWAEWTLTFAGGALFYWLLLAGLLELDTLFRRLSGRDGSRPQSDTN
jgi:hypothetical protein